MGDAPQDPGRETRKVKLAELGDRPRTANRGERAEIAIAERGGGAPLPARDQRAGNILALLLGNGSHARKRCSVRASYRCGIADDKDVGMTGQAEVRTDHDTAGTVMLGAEPTGGGRRGYAGSPQHCSGGDAVTADDDTVGVDVFDAAAEADLDAEALQAALRDGGGLPGAAMPGRAGQ